jgi:predicted phosphodiesterase
MILVLVIILAICRSAANAASTVGKKPGFVVNPYLQLGTKPWRTVCWIYKGPADFKFEYRSENDSNWKTAELKEQALYSAAELRFLCAEMHAPAVEYKLTCNGNISFDTQIKKEQDDAMTFALLGDLGYDANKPKKLVERISGIDPDMVILTGDLLSPEGTVSSYLDKFFPAFNSTEKRSTGLMGRTTFVACAGDRDIAADKFDPSHDNRKFFFDGRGAMAYFCLWKQPQNGPPKLDNANAPALSGDPNAIKAFIASAGDAYPAGANFSFDRGDSHWLVLDGGSYVNWQEPKWRAWLENDLQQSKKKWKFVLIHQPGFSSDTEHGEEQNMRNLCDLFQSGGVDIVFSGHSNSYQRSCPMRFLIDKSNPVDSDSKVGFVFGKFVLDKKFDAEKNCKPDGVIYVVTGGGGAAPAAEMRIQADSTRWQSFTRKFYCQKDSFSFLQIKYDALTLQQISEDGELLDELKICK